jgi:CheY-like chemotaxis protein
MSLPRVLGTFARLAAVLALLATATRAMGQSSRDGAQPNPGVSQSPLQSSPPALADRSELPGLSEYLTFLQEETRSHRELVESFYERLSWVLGGLFLLIGTIVIWATSRARREIREIAERLTKPYIRRILDEEERVVAEARKSTTDLLEGMRKTIETTSDALGVLKADVEIVKAAEHFRGRPELQDTAVLWVDDDPKNVDFPHKVLNNAGVYVERKGSTEGALNALSTDRFDVLVTNLEREGKETAGIELLERMHARQLTVPAVVFSRAWRLARHGHEVHALGARTAADYATLLRHIAEILGHRSRPVPAIPLHASRGGPITLQPPTSGYPEPAADRLPQQDGVLASASTPAAASPGDSQEGTGHERD